MQASSTAAGAFTVQPELTASHETCASLHQHLHQLRELTGEMLHQDAEGKVDLIDVTPDRVDTLKRQLQEVWDLTEVLETNLLGE